MSVSDQLRESIRAAHLQDEGQALDRLIASASLSSRMRSEIGDRAAELVRSIRANRTPGLMETFLSEYGLSSTEGVALMCLAEALLRVPDVETMDALVQDKIAPADWGRHLGRSASSLVNASTWALLFTGRVLREDTGAGLVANLQDLVRRLGEPVVRVAVSQAMRAMGQQFVLGEDIDAAMERAQSMEGQGYTYSYDMLGEAACTEDDARRYHLAYANAIGRIAKACNAEDLRRNPGISVKLSALHCRYEFGQRGTMGPEVGARLSSLLALAKSANMGLNIDAEESERLDLSLDVIEAALADPALADWDGFGVVVQAYGKRAAYVIDWLYELARRYDRKLMVRLVKGAYWDTEIKRAQVLGLDGFPVFTRKQNTDVSYISCARQLLGMTDRIYPQFATHNAHTVAAVLAMADGARTFEFQRLHGMGEALHDRAVETSGVTCRIYAPVGAHEDLLAYLVRRLLENGANSSFVNQIVDPSTSAEDIAADPFALVASADGAAHLRIKRPGDLFGPQRRNSKGLDLDDPHVEAKLDDARGSFLRCQWHAAPSILDAMPSGTEQAVGYRIKHREVRNPAKVEDLVGTVVDANSADVQNAFAAADRGFVKWAGTPVEQRAAALRGAADRFEAAAVELIALATREAGKTVGDGVAEIREAVDFLRYYADEGVRLERLGTSAPLGTVVCISPWNFPLAIFTGQIAAALVTGNVVLAKPAEQTALMAHRAVQILHESGVPVAALQLLPGGGQNVGGALVSDARVAAVCFTGSTQTAQAINRALAEHAAPGAPLVAETGGINAMILDSTALPEQAVRDVIVSAFQSAGQRCSATRILYVQEDVAERTLRMLKGAMAALRVGDPWELASDLGPVIDRPAAASINGYLRTKAEQGDLIAQFKLPSELAGSYFVPPSIVRVDTINDIADEVFGPVLHLATFEVGGLAKVIDDINARGFGLTLGVHSRVDQRVQEIVEAAQVGNIYINRNQIGAVVGSQPFGGRGLSGTGPKAGGPLYARRFRSSSADLHATVELGETDMPGPTGESNRYRLQPRGRVACAGTLGLADDLPTLRVQMSAAGRFGNDVVDASKLTVTEIARLKPLDTVLASGDAAQLRQLRQALAARDGAIVPLLVSPWDVCGVVSERTLCIDTTAAGGNASLLAEIEG